MLHIMNYGQQMMKTTPQAAMILAAGLGTRMRPLTDRLPKPLVEVAGRPLIDYAFDLLREAEISGVVVNTHYLAQQLRDYLAHKAQFDIHESYEPQLLETGGGIAHALPLLPDAPFFVLNSDTICLSTGESGSVLRRMQACWNPQDMDMLLLLMPRLRAIGYDGKGDFVCEKQGSTMRYRRRLKEESSAEYVFTGVQILKPKVFEACPEGAFSMNHIYNSHCDADGYFQRMGFVVHDGDWLHVGDPAAREAAEKALQKILPKR